jgi:argininosuccinate synthase
VWLIVVADVGQEEDFETAKKKALKIGAVAVYVEVLFTSKRRLTNRTFVRSLSKN